MPSPIKMLPKKPYIEFTPERKALYLEYFRQTMHRALSAEKVGISLRTVDEHRQRDPEFREQMDEAKRQYVEENYIEQARKFALEGMEKPIIGGKERNEIVAYEREYSPDMLKFLIRQSDSSFRDGAERKDDDAAVAAAAGGLVGIVLPKKAIDGEDWKARYQNAARGVKPDGSPYES